MSLLMPAGTRQTINSPNELLRLEWSMNWKIEGKGPYNAGYWMRSGLWGWNQKDSAHEVEVRQRSQQSTETITAKTPKTQTRISHMWRARASFTWCDSGVATRPWVESDASLLPVSSSVADVWRHHRDSEVQKFDSKNINLITEMSLPRQRTIIRVEPYITLFPHCWQLTRLRFSEIIATLLLLKRWSFWKKC